MSTKALTEELHKKFSMLSEEDIKFAVNTVFDSMKKQLVAGNRIEIRKFGSFSIRLRKYPGRDDLYNTVYYKMSKNVAENLNPKLSER